MIFTKQQIYIGGTQWTKKRLSGICFWTAGPDPAIQCSGGFPFSGVGSERCILMGETIFIAAETMAKPAGPAAAFSAGLDPPVYLLESNDGQLYL